MRAKLAGDQFGERAHLSILPKETDRAAILVERIGEADDLELLIHRIGANVLGFSRETAEVLEDHAIPHEALRLFFP